MHIRLDVVSFLSFRSVVKIALIFYSSDFDRAGHVVEQTDAY